MSEPTWWIVVSSKRGPADQPVRHASEHIAELEARRLAAKRPEDSFTVYRAVMVVEAPRVVVRRLEDDDAPPF